MRSVAPQMITMDVNRLNKEPGARFPTHTHEGPGFVFILEGELVQAGRRLGPGWASVARAGTIDEDVHSETGCVFRPR